MKDKLLAAVTCFGLLVGCQTNTVTSEQNVDRQVLYVHQDLVDCIGVAPMQCMQVRTNPSAEWSFFYSNIEGFEYEPGYQYRLIVDVINVPNPPADGSALRYVLVDLVEKSKQR